MRMSILASALVLLVAETAACPAAMAASAAAPDSASTPLTPERAVKYRRISDLLFSPDGLSAVCVVSEFNGPQSESHLWLVDVKDGGLRQLTDSPKQERSPEWSPRADSVAFLSNRTEPTQVYVIPRNGGEAHAVTHSPTPVHLFRWSPDGTQIAYLAREPDPNQAANSPHIADRPEDVERLWVVDISTGVTRRLTDGTLRIDEFGWSAPDRLLAVASDRPADETWTTALYEIGVASPGVVRAIGHPNQPFGGLTFSPEHRQFGFLSTDHEGPIPHDLFLQSVGGASARNVTASIDRKVAEIHWQDESNLFVRVADGFYYRIVRIDSRNVPHWIALPHSVRTFDVSRDGSLIFAGVDFDQLPELFLRHPDGKVVQLGELQDKTWARVRLNDAEIFKLKSFDGTVIEAALMKPHSAAAVPPPAGSLMATDAAPSAKAPLIVLAHGGPASSFMSDYFWFNAWPQLLATHGYQVLLVNPRGSIGYGERFEKANRADLGGGDFKDLMAATDAVIARGEVDSNRLGIGGWSYGAQMTEWAIGHTTRFKAAVSGQGVFNEALEFYTEVGPASDEWYFGTPWEHPDVYARNSPSTFIGNARTPILIVHMEGDVTNPLSQSQGLYRALKHLGVEAELVTYAEDAHLPLHEQFQIDVMQRMLDWYDHHLK